MSISGNQPIAKATDRRDPGSRSPDEAPAETEALEPIRGGRALLLVQRSGGNVLMRRLVVVDRATSTEQELLPAESFGWAAERIVSRVTMWRAPDAPEWFEVSLQVGRMSKPLWLVDTVHERVVELDAVPADIRGGGYMASPAPSGEWILACAQHAAWQPEGIKMSCAVVRTSGNDATVRWRMDEPETSYVRWLGSDHLVVWSPSGDTPRCVSIDLATGTEHPLSPRAD